MGAEFRSQYYNKACPYCGESISVGAACGWDAPWGQRKVVHAECVGKWREIHVPTWTPTADQEAIRQWFHTHRKQPKTSSLIVEANPGSGKTATLKLLITEYAAECLQQRRTFPRTPVLLMAFDNEIVNALRKAIQLPGFCDISTFHSFGARLIPWKTVRLKDPITGEFLSPEYKIDVLFKTELHPGWKKWSPKQREDGYRRLYKYKKLIEMCQAHLLTPNTFMASLQDIADRYEVSLPEQQKEPDFYQELHRLFELDIKHQEMVSFSNMLYFPFFFGVPFPSYEWVGIDEGQDQSPIRQWFVKRLQEEAWQTSLS